MTERLDVRLADRTTDRLVGSLVDVGTGPHFQYAPAFLQERLELSPILLHTDTRVFTPGPIGLHRLQGLFFDALPDGWGLRLLHQAMRDAGLDATQCSAVTWLRALGTHGMGALTFHPPLDEVRDGALELADLATLAAEARAVDAAHVDEVLPALVRAGGSSGGARPKIVAGWHDSGAIVDAFMPLLPGYRPVLIKFASHRDPEDTPLVEAAYLSMAAHAGIEVPPHHVHPLPDGQWALVVDRFDRVGETRRHVHSLAGLLEIDIRHDLVDYEALLKVALQLTGDFRVVTDAWQRAAFNVGAYNRDDHARNVAFLMAPDGTWQLAPAYDLTHAAGVGGYHAMSVAGESRTPGRDDLLRLAEHGGVARRDAVSMLDRIRSALDDWTSLAARFGIARERARDIAQVLKRQSALLGLSRGQAT